MTQAQTPETQQLIETAHALADAARAAILPVFRGADLSIENKLDGGFDPVTEADKAAERAMRAILAERRPDDGILGEEYGHAEGTSGWTWVLDPIDGTRAFMAGAPTWGVLIAVSDDTGPKFGIVDQPYIGERFCGGFGLSTYSGPMGDRSLGTRATRDLSEAVIMTTFPEVGTPDEMAAFQGVAEKCKLTRYGMDCYAYALVAAGQIDLVIEAGLNAYDIQAPMAVIEAAGGIVTDWNGNPAHNGGQVIAAANADIHAQALAAIQKR